MLSNLISNDIDKFLRKFPLTIYTVGKNLVTLRNHKKMSVRREKHAMTVQFLF